MNLSTFYPFSLERIELLRESWFVKVYGCRNGYSQATNFQHVNLVLRILIKKMQDLEEAERIYTKMRTESSIILAVTFRVNNNCPTIAKQTQCGVLWHLITPPPSAELQVKLPACLSKAAILSVVPPPPPGGYTPSDMTPSIPTCRWSSRVRSAFASRVKYAAAPRRHKIFIEEQGPRNAATFADGSSFSRVSEPRFTVKPV